MWAKLAGATRGVRMFHTWPGCPKTYGEKPSRAQRSKMPYRACLSCQDILSGGRGMPEGGYRVNAGRKKAVA
jgi:hypothetical protein